MYMIVRAGQALIKFSRFHLERKVRVEWEVLSSSDFVGSWVNVARMA